MEDRKNGRYRVGTVGVDAGMVMVGDPCYLNDYGKKSTDGFEWVEAEVDSQKISKKFDYSYSGACAATLSEHSAGELGRSSAVAVSSGYGDGVYPVYATYNHEGRISKLEVVFVAEDDEDFENDDEDDDDDHAECTECGERYRVFGDRSKCDDCTEAEDKDEEEA